MDNWKPLGGTSRKYVNTSTGEILSRHTYDLRYGALREHKSYKKKSEVNRKKNPKLSAARPAPNRPSKVPEYRVENDAIQLRSKGNKKYRNIEIPIKMIDGNFDFETFSEMYDATVNGLAKNSRVFGAGVYVAYKTGRLRDYKNLVPSRPISELPSADQIVDMLMNFRDFKYGGSTGMKFLHIALHVIFTSSHMAKIVRN